MNNSSKLTVAVIEAGVSAYSSALHDTGEISEDTLSFLKLVAESDRLRAEIDRFIELMMEPESDDNKREVRVGLICDLFFWTGWHARGAIEDQERLEGL